MTTDFVSLSKHAMSAAVATVALTACGFAALDLPGAAVPASAVSSFAYCAPTASSFGHRSVGNHLTPHAAALTTCLPAGSEQG